jgi:hypothetical protein
MSTVRTCSPAFHFCHQASFCSDASLDASVAIAKASPGKSGGSSWPVGVLVLPLDLPTPFEWPIHQVGRCVSRIPDSAGQKWKRLLGLRAASSTDLVGVQPEFRQRTQAIVAWLGRPGRSQRLRRRRDSPNPAPTKASDIGPGTALDAATVLMVMVS